MKSRVAEANTTQENWRHFLILHPSLFLSCR